MTEKCEGGDDDAGVVCGTDEDEIDQLDVPLGKDLKFGCKGGCIKLKKVSIKTNHIAIESKSIGCLFLHN